MLPDPEFLLRHDRPGPRYTSYPTAPVWQPQAPAAWDEALGSLPPDEAVSVYVHVPFCREQCWYCGCNMVVSGLASSGDRYLDALERQVDTLPLPAATLPLVRLHLGGGTPTWLSPAQLARLFALVERRFRDLPDAVRSVEVDPEVTTDAHLDALAAAGVRRLSVGVQSFDPVVLTAVNRPQATERVHAVVEGARARGIGSINLDLMYGLPKQDPASMASTLERVLELRPERLAVFGYAHVPWMKSHQRKLDGPDLPDARGRLELLLLAHRTLADAGYVAIGFDHFALPDDALAVAAREGTLHRDFMGYTERPRSALVGLGTSAISETDGWFLQQDPVLGSWWRTIEAGGTPVHKGLALSRDDRLRRDAILALTCNGRLDLDDLGARHDVDARIALADGLRAVQPLAREGIVDVDADGITVTDRGRLLVRNVAMAFDAYLQPDASRFSRVI
jgi:oxygen-independent coproporphyrinogen-3 oxidase